jgi:hypothetical protein
MEGAPFSLDGGLLVRRGSVRLGLTESLDLIRGLYELAVLQHNLLCAAGQIFEEEVVGTGAQNGGGLKGKGRSNAKACTAQKKKRSSDSSGEESIGGASVG